MFFVERQNISPRVEPKARDFLDWKERKKQAEQNEQNWFPVMENMVNETKLRMEYLFCWRLHRGPRKFLAQHRIARLVENVQLLDGNGEGVVEFDIPFIGNCHQKQRSCGVKPHLDLLNLWVLTCRSSFKKKRNIEGEGYGLGHR